MTYDDLFTSFNSKFRRIWFPQFPICIGTRRTRHYIMVCYATKKEGTGESTAIRSELKKTVINSPTYPIPLSSTTRPSSRVLLPLSPHACKSPSSDLCAASPTSLARHGLQPASVA
jgi:hypothetical protein